MDRPGLVLRRLLAAFADQVEPGEGLPAIRAYAATADPSGCRWCGTGLRDHFQRWTDTAGWHGWTAPTQQQIKARMIARRADRITRKTAAPGWTPEAAEPNSYRELKDMSHDLTFERTTLGHQMTAAMVLAHLIERGPREEVEWKLDRLGRLHGHVHRPNSDEQARRALDQFANFLGTVVARSQGHGKGSEWIHLAATGTYRGVPVNVWTHVAIRSISPYGSTR